MCISCDIYGADHDTPTEPGLPVSNLRVHRAFNRTVDDMIFDAPILPVTYVGTRKSAVKARQRERSQALTQCIWMLNVGAAVLVAFLSYLLSL